MNQLIGYLSEGEQLKGSLTIPQQLGGSTLGSKTITANGVYDATDEGLDGYDIVTANVPNTYAAGDEGKVVDNGALVSQTTATYTVNNTYDTTKIKSVTVNVGGGSPTLETITKTYTPSTSQQTETITPGAGYDAIGEVDVTVDAMPTGTEGTPTATKGTVSNHSVSVTPSVTNQAGYIAGGTKTGTAVTVSASELDSGTKSITANGNNQDVVGYAAVNVAVPNSYSAADEGKVVSNGALVSQTSDTVTINDTYDTTLINSLTVNVSGGSKTNIDIGIQNTSISNILNMFYALEQGTAKTGEFTLSTAIPNSETEIFDTGLSTVNGLFVADESQNAYISGGSPDNVLFAIVFDPTSEGTGSYAFTRLVTYTTYGTNQNGVTRKFLNRCSWAVRNGKLYCTGDYNANDNYTPFHSGHTFRWVAW